MTDDTLCRICGQRTMHGRHLNARICGEPPIVDPQPVDDEDYKKPVVTIYPKGPCLCGGSGLSGPGMWCAACMGSGVRIEPKR